MSSIDANYDYVASLCEASAALRSENVQLRRERDEARAERDQLTLRLAKITAELAVARKESDTLTNGLSVLLRDANPTLAKRSLELTEPAGSSAAKRTRTAVPEEPQPYALTGFVEILPAQKEDPEEEEPEPEDEEDNPVQQWVQKQSGFHPQSTFEKEELDLQKFRSWFWTDWQEDDPLEEKFRELLAWVFNRHRRCLQHVMATFDSYACWSFGRLATSSGPCPWARTLSTPFSCETDPVHQIRVSSCGFCDKPRHSAPIGICMWLCHANGVDTGFPERDTLGIMRSRNEGRKVAGKRDWETPEIITADFRNKQIRWIVHTYG